MTDNQNNQQQNKERSRFAGAPVQPPLKDTPLGNPSLRPVMPGVQAFLTMGAVLLCLLGTSCFLHAASAAYQILFAVLTATVGEFWLCRNVKSVSGLLMCLLPAGLLLSVGSIVLSALYAACLCVCVGTARLLCHGRVKETLLTVAVGFLISILTCGTICATLPLGFAAAGIVLGLCTMAFKSRVSAICSAAAAMLVFLCVTGALVVVSEKGALSGDNVLAVINEIREQIIAAFKEVNDTYTASFGRFLPASSGEETPALFDEALIGELIGTLFNLLPAIAVLSCLIPSYFAQAVLVSSCEAEDKPVYTGLQLHRFALSPIAAALFILCEICALFAFRENAFSAVIENIYLILLPGLFLVGLFNLINLFRIRSTSHGGEIAVILFCCIMPMFAIPLLSFLGAYLIVRGFIAMLIMRHRNE